MRPQKVQDEQIISALVKSFRTNGYEGSSLAELAESTGLKKASLYHRFPKGKEEMANVVLSYIEEWVGEHIFKVLLDETLSVEDRLKNTLIQVRKSYDYGNDACIFRALSIGNSLELFDLKIKTGMSKWISAFHKFGLTIGLTNEIAEQEAKNTLIKIQGSLVVTKGLNDLTVFENTLKEIETNYLNIST